MKGLAGAVRVTRSGSVLLEAAGGIADRRTGIACGPQTRFQLASISKRFTAAAVLLLVEDGALALTHPVDRFLAGCPGDWRPVTVHQLLTHTSGIGHWNDIAGYDLSQPQDPADQLALYQRQPMHGAPGGQWHYSSPGYQLLGWIVEQVSGGSHAAFVRERILTPLRLESTTISESGPAGNLARGYRDGVEVPPWRMDTNTGTGDVTSTVADLARFTAALDRSAGLLTASSRQAMSTVHAEIGSGPAGEPWTVDGYGYGCFLGTVLGRRAHFHPGDNPGYRSFAAYLPDDDTTIAILANDDERVDLSALVRKLPQAIPDWPEPAPAPAG